jgi:tetratricopeptide (TPR) repeat protein
LGGDETLQIDKNDVMLEAAGGVGADVGMDIGTDGTDIDALASAIDAEIEASGAVIDPVTDIDIGTGVGGDIGTDISAADISTADISTADISTDFSTAGIDTDIGTDVGTDIDALASAIDAEIEASGAVIDPISEISGIDARGDGGDAGDALQVIDMNSVAGIDASSASDDVLDGAGADDLEARLSELFNDGLYADSQAAEEGAAPAEGVAIDTEGVAVGAESIAADAEGVAVGAESVAVDADGVAADTGAAAAEEEDGSITAMISKINVIEAEEEAAPPEPEAEADADDVQEKLRQLFNAEGEGAPKTLDIGLGASGEDIPAPAGGGLDERDTPFDLPDHVLTSTLADIYYQQGQPQLALHIYERLYQRDPSDERLADKIEEIKLVLQTGGEGGGGEPQTKPVTQEKARAASSGRKKKGAGGAKEELDIRPLAGVRIKKSAPAKKGKRAKKS